MARSGPTKRPRQSLAPENAGSGKPRTIGIATELREIDLALIDLPRRPARRHLADIDSLAASLKDYGLQQPISVREAGGRFVLTSGMRRVAAARSLGWTTIPAFVRSISEDQAYVVDLIENLQRQDLSPEEEADAMMGLVRTRGWTLQQLADAVKRSVGYISKRVRVFDDPLLRLAVTDRGLPISTAEELLAARVDERGMVIDRALLQHWDQTQARRAIQRMNAAPEKDAPSAEQQRAERTDRPRRPQGLTRAVREFHRSISMLTAENLTSADVAALRALLRDLLILARPPSRRSTASARATNLHERGSHSARRHA